MGFDAVTFYRLGHRLKGLGVPLLPAVLQKSAQLVFGVYLPVGAKLGQHLELGYGGMGVVIHRDAVVGRHCLLSQQVTLGGRSGKPGAPRIGNFVRIGAGAKVLGNITVGDFAVIGANAVVLQDVPRAGVVAGVPARLIRIDPHPVEGWEREVGRPFPEDREQFEALSPTSGRGMNGDRRRETNGATNGSKNFGTSVGGVERAASRSHR